MRERLLANPTIARLKPSGQRARLVDASLRFFVREALGSSKTAVYGLRDAPGIKVALRHGTPDAETFDMVFCQHVHELPAEVETLLASLGRPPAVLDVGANIGLFAAWAAARWPAARITCVEPDPGNVEVLRRAAAANDGWSVVAAAAGTRDGELRFHAGHFATSRAALPGEEDRDVIAVPQRDLFELAAGHDLLKIDIEGGEWPILADPRLAELPVTALALEYHPHGCPGEDPHAEADRLLRAAGFELARAALPYGAPAEEGSLWAWRARS